MRALVPVAFALGVCGAIASVAAAGCMLVTGSTDGYGSPDTGVTTINASSCGVCEAGSVCCISAAPPNYECLPSCTLAALQLCDNDHPCGLTGTCTTETCSFGGASIYAQTCGPTPLFCAPPEGGPPNPAPDAATDAPASDASAADASLTGSD